MREHLRSLIQFVCIQMPQGEQVAVLTGSSSGVGHETSFMLARNGFDTYATMRKLDNRGGGSKEILGITKNKNLLRCIPCFFCYCSKSNQTPLIFFWQTLVDISLNAIFSLLP
jgi:hypothetical protein